MSRIEATPPRWAVALLRLVLPDGSHGECVQADLDEEFKTLSASATPGAARRWYGWEAIKISAHFMWSDASEAWAHKGEGGGMDRMWQNMRIALRRFGRAPGFSVVAVLTMALGIGANVAIVSVVDTVLLDPLPYEDSEELVALWEWNVPRDNRTNVANSGNFAAWRDRASSFESVTAVSMMMPAKLRGAGEPDEVRSQYASPPTSSRSWAWRPSWVGRLLPTSRPLRPRRLFSPLDTG